MSDDVLERIERDIAPLISGNNMPCMSGDPRDRLSPLQRRLCSQIAERALTASRSYSDEIEEALKLAARRLDAAADRSNEDGDVAAAVGYRTWAQEALAALKVQTGERHGQ